MYYLWGAGCMRGNTVNDNFITYLQSIKKELYLPIKMNRPDSKQKQHHHLNSRQTFEFIYLSNIVNLLPQRTVHVQIVLPEREY